MYHNSAIRPIASIIKSSEVDATLWMAKADRVAPATPAKPAKPSAKNAIGRTFGKR